MPETPELHLIIVAAGASSRFGAPDKILQIVEGKPVLVHSIERLLPAVTGRIVVVTPPGRTEEFRTLVSRCISVEKIRWCAGGASRSASVRCGIAALGEDCSGYAAVHDAARPLADAELLESLFAAALQCDGALPGKPEADTLWKCDEESMLVNAVSREHLWAVETPQLFRLDAWREANLRFPGSDFTDDAGLLRHAGYRICMVHNRAPNFKITYADDLTLMRQTMERLSADGDATLTR